MTSEHSELSHEDQAEQDLFERYCRLAGLPFGEKIAIRLAYYGPDGRATLVSEEDYPERQGVLARTHEPGRVCLLPIEHQYAVQLTTGDSRDHHTRSTKGEVKKTETTLANLSTFPIDVFTVEDLTCLYVGRRTH